MSGMHNMIAIIWRLLNAILWKHVDEDISEIEQIYTYSLLHEVFLALCTLSVAQ